MRKHIAKALRVRSQAIRTAIDRYNTAAASLHPPRKSLQWDDVIEYGFLSEFDLLRDTRQDIRTKTWATPTGRFAMDLHFKMLRAREEIDRLNIEVRRFLTFIQDEDRFLRGKEDGCRASDVVLAHQISVYRMQHGRFAALHIHRLEQISQLPGFTGSMAPGLCLALNQPLVATPDATGSPAVHISSPIAAHLPTPPELPVEREPRDIDIPEDGHIDGGDDTEADDDDDEDDAAVELMRNAFVQIISVSD
jgi:hypothetical protein